MVSSSLEIYYETEKDKTEKERNVKVPNGKTRKMNTCWLSNTFPSPDKTLVHLFLLFLAFLSLKFTNLNRGEEKKYYKLREDSKG